MSEIRDHGVNVPVLRKALEHITAHPEEWDQCEWARETACGTSYCLAGTIVIQQGYQVQWSGCSYYADHVTTGEWIDEVACREAGLPDFTAYQGHLFSPDNSLHDLWRISSELTNGEIEIPSDLPARA